MPEERQKLEAERDALSDPATVAAIVKATALSMVQSLVPYLAPSLEDTVSLVMAGQLGTRIEGIESDIGELLDEMTRELEEPHFDTTQHGRLESELKVARADAEELIRRLSSLERAVSWSPEEADERESSALEAMENSAPTGRFF